MLSLNNAFLSYIIIKNKKIPNCHRKRQAPPLLRMPAPLISGAYDRNRTGDLILTKDALYRLSYVGSCLPLRKLSRRHKSTTNELIQYLSFFSFQMLFLKKSGFFTLFLNHRDVNIILPSPLFKEISFKISDAPQEGLFPPFQMQHAVRRKPKFLFHPRIRAISSKRQHVFTG